MHDFPKRRRTVAAAGTGVLVLMALAGCSVLKPKKDPSQFFVLRPIAGETGGGSGTTSAGPWITIGPCNIAAYLDRTGMVTSKTANELEVSEFHLWAEPIDKAISVVVASNVGAILKSSKVIPYPEAETRASAYRVALLVKRFEPNRNREIELVCTWAIRAKGEEDSDVAAASSRIIVPIEGEPGDFGAQAAAMSRALHKLSSRIAARLRSRITADKKKREEEKETE